MNDTITAVPGVTAGHASSSADGTGCTVLLGPFRGAVDVRGLATGTREIDALSPNHLVPQIDALVLSGGSAPGLAAADGVLDWLRERGRGLDVGVTRIPIVPAAVIFDLVRADQQSPDPAMGRAACDAAGADPLSQGRVGAGTGARVGKVPGAARSEPGGIGSFATTHASYTIGALAVVNALGDVLHRDGSILAGARNDDGSPIDSMMAAVHARGDAGPPITNTTLCVIATDAPLTRVALQTVARMGSSAIVRRIAPANTVFDGDIVFALSTSGSAVEYSPAALLSIGAAAQLVLEEAIIRAVMTVSGR